MTKELKNRYAYKNQENLIKKCCNKKTEESMVYIKALSIQNCKTLVYAHQCYSEIGMRSGFYSCRINKEQLFIPDGNWIVWHLNAVVCEVLSDDEFRNQYIIYNDLPLSMKKLADMYPDYETWIEEVNTTDAS